MEPLACLQHRMGDNWLIDRDSQYFLAMTEQLCQTLTQLRQDGLLPKILLVEQEPVSFLAGFMAACITRCPIFLGSPHWVEQEWQQVLDAVKPDLIWSSSCPKSSMEMQAIADVAWTSSPLATLNQGKSMGKAGSKESSDPLAEGWIMIPTGGSSGRVRFAIHTWQTLTASVQGFRQYFQEYFQQGQVDSFCVLPLYHVSGLMQFLRSFTSGGKLAIAPFKALEAGQCPDLNPANFFISLVPTQLQRLFQHSEQTHWLSQFQTVLLGGAPAWTELLDQARHYRIRLAPTYGMTETASQIATLKPEAFLNGCRNCGEVLPHANVTIRSSTGEVLGTNQIGLVTIQAKSFTLGYYPHLLTHSGNLQLDDLGFFDAQGYLNIVGRSSNKIITGGENVFPDEVEAALQATGLVADVCIVGVPDQGWGQAISAVYVPIRAEISAVNLRAALADKLSRFKHPKHWISLENLPRNAQGKVNRQQVEAIATLRCNLSRTPDSITIDSSELSHSDLE